MEYIRKVVYLYECRDGKRQFTRPGFARLERRNGIWNLSVIPEENGLKGSVSLYIVGERQGRCVAYDTGQVDIENPIHRQLDAKIGWFIRELQSIRGILIGERGHYLAGECAEAGGEVSFEVVEEWEPHDKLYEKPQALAAAVVETDEKMKKDAEQVQEEQNEEHEGHPETAEMAETTEMEEGEKPQDSGEDRRFSGLQAMYPFEDDEMEWCYQIEPKDLGNFSAEQWHMASNSFLLQGYYNYRHLIFAHKKGKNYIGVPGQFHRREQYLASRFGFSQFKGTQKKRVTMGDFGYWMCEVN